MKKLTPILSTLILSVALSCLVQAQEKAKPATTAKATTKAMSTAKVDNSTMPYTAVYSSNFEMGDPAKSRLVLEMWKDFDDNALDRHAAILADTAKIFLSDGQVLTGKDNMMSGMKMYRNSMTSLSSDIHAFMSFRSIDKNHDWVAVWGTENTTTKDGLKNSSNLHEIWRFNKDGKVDEIRQYSSKMPASTKE